MDFELIERLMRMLESSALDELDVTEGNLRIRLAKRRNSAPSEGMEDPAPALEADSPQANSASLVEIRAGMAGAFYRAPAPGADPFTAVGATVAEGDQIAVVEAMKMLNPIESECSGIIRAIHVEDGGGVEPGTLLFEIEKRRWN